MAHDPLSETGGPSMTLGSDGRWKWLFPDGTILPVVSGGDGPLDGAGDGNEGGEGSGDGDGGEGDGGELDAEALKAELAKSRGIRGDLDKKLKKALADLDAANKKSMSADEKALSDAKDAAKAEARAEMAPRLLAAEVKAASAGRLDEAQRTALIENLDATKFLTDDGDVDTEKVKALIDGLAPQDGTSGKKKTDIGQGRTGGTPKPSVSSGKELFAALRGGKKSND